MEAVLDHYCVPWHNNNASRIAARNDRHRADERPGAAVARRRPDHRAASCLSKKAGVHVEFTTSAGRSRFAFFKILLSALVELDGETPNALIASREADAGPCRAYHLRKHFPTEVAFPTCCGRLRSRHRIMITPGQTAAAITSTLRADAKDHAVLKKAAVYMSNESLLIVLFVGLIAGGWPVKSRVAPASACSATSLSAFVGAFIGIGCCLRSAPILASE